MSGTARPTKNELLRPGIIREVKACLVGSVYGVAMDGIHRRGYVVLDGCSMYDVGYHDIRVHTREACRQNIEISAIITYGLGCLRWYSTVSKMEGQCISSAHTDGMVITIAWSGQKEIPKREKKIQQQRAERFRAGLGGEDRYIGLRSPPGRTSSGLIQGARCRYGKGCYREAKPFHHLRRRPRIPLTRRKKKTISSTVALRTPHDTWQKHNFFRDAKPCVTALHGTNIK